jgi:hypothetical protein
MQSDTWFVEQCHGDKAMNTHVCTSLENAHALAEQLLLFFGNARIFQLVDGKEVDIA